MHTIQPMHVAEVFTGQPGVYVPLADTIRSFKAILDGEYDDLPEGMTAAAVIRGKEVFIAGPDVVVQAEDHLIIFYQEEMVRKVEKYFRVSPDFF